MKGVELIASIIAFLFLFAVSFVLIGLVIYVDNVVRPLTHSTYQLVVSPIHQPIKYETLLLAYLETTDNGVPMKKILTEAANQDKPGTSSNPAYVDGVAVDNLLEYSQKIFSNWMGNSPYVLVLRIDDHEYILSEDREGFPLNDRDILNVRKISTKIFSPNHDSSLDLYVI